MSQALWPTAGSYSRALEGADRAEIEGLQLAKLQSLVARLYETNAFYRKHMKSHGITPRHISSLSSLSQLPPVTKKMFVADQEAHPPFGKRLGVDESEVAMIHVTSGTSGQGREVYGLTTSDIEVVTDSSVAMWRWAGLQPDDIASSMVPVTNSAAGVSMRPAVLTAGRYPYHVGHLPYGERIDWFQRFGVNAIYGMPSYFAALTGICEERGIDPRSAFPDMRTFVLAGESYPIAWAQRLQEYWGAAIHETYGSTQTGGTCTAGTCRKGAVPNGDRGRLHLFEWTVFYEVVDPATGKHVAPGETGELYVTTLDRQASPTLRFASGDRARWYSWNDGCDCGLPLGSLEAGTIGRLDDMLKIKGMNIWPEAVDEIVLAYPGVEDYRATIEVDDRGRTNINLDALVLEPGRSADLTRDLGAVLKSRIGVTFEVREVGRQDFEQHEFKARRWIDRRSETMEGRNL
jgi:phenylacetate-CoA ligase